MQAADMVRGGQAECTMAMGFEKMQPGSLGSVFDDRSNPLEKHAEAMINIGGFAPAPMAAQFFGNAGKVNFQALFSYKIEFFRNIWKNSARNSLISPKSPSRTSAIP
jgi:acetyl-CoA acetyltransferase